MPLTLFVVASSAMKSLAMKGLICIAMICLFFIDDAGIWVAWMCCAASAWRTQIGGALAIFQTSTWQATFSRPLAEHPFVLSSCTGQPETLLPIRIIKTLSWR